MRYRPGGEGLAVRAYAPGMMARALPSCLLLATHPTLELSNPARDCPNPLARRLARRPIARLTPPGCLFDFRKLDQPMLSPSAPRYPHAFHADLLRYPSGLGG